MSQKSHTMSYKPIALRLLLHLCIIGIGVYLAATALSKPLVEFGDGREYVIQTQSIVFDHQFAIDPTRRALYWNATNPFGLELATTPSSPHSPISRDEPQLFGGNFGALYLDTSGDLRFIHSWVYSLAVAPIYAICHWIGEGHFEYYSFTIANIVLLFLPLLVLWLRHTTLGTLAFITLLLASPITAHLQFAHSEIFCFSMLTLSFLSISMKRGRYISVFLLGLGAAQNIPIVLFFPLHLWLSYCSLQGGTLHQKLRILAFPYAVGIAAPLGIIVYNLLFFGTGNLIAHIGHADPSYITLQRLVSIFISPIVGALWYFPAAWLAVLLALMQGRIRHAIAFITSMFVVALLSTTTSNLNSAQLSACRYAIWFLAPLYILPFLQTSYISLTAIRRSIVIFAYTGAVAIQLWLGTWRFLLGEWLALSSLRRATPEVAALYRHMHLHDDIEPIVENILGSELRTPFSFSGIYIWNLGKLKDERSLWIISKRALLRSPIIEVRSSPDLFDDAAILTVFDLVRRDRSVSRLRVKPSTRFEQHPVFGGYLMLWVSGRVLGVRSQAPVTIKN